MDCILRSLRFEKVKSEFSISKQTNFKEKLFNGNEHLVVHLEYVIIFNNDYLIMKIA